MRKGLAAYLTHIFPCKQVPVVRLAQFTKPG